MAQTVISIKQTKVLTKSIDLDDYSDEVRAAVEDGNVEFFSDWVDQFDEESSELSDLETF